MDKKKLARTLAVIGGILMLVVVILWFVPTMSYSYSDKTLGTVNATISPMGYFAQGAAPTATFYKNVLQKIDKNYNTNVDMYWLVGGVIFSVVALAVSLAKGHKLIPKYLCAVMSLFMLVGVILCPVLHMSFLWVAYLIVAILAVVAHVGALVLDYMGEA